MELQTAREIVDTLAQGIHPMTGDVMPEDSPYNAPPVIRALFAVSQALDGDAETERLQESRYVAVIGNAFDGLHLIGPFSSAEKASHYGDNAGVPYVVTHMSRPKD